MPYSAYVLTDESRSRLLQAFPPKFPNVIAHHVTEYFGLPANSQPPKPATVRVFGYACDESLEALVVSVDGDTTRPDGKLYHITLSLDRLAGRRPVDSNTLLAQYGFSQVFESQSLELETTPEILK
jgi:hypothetical protein